VSLLSFLLPSFCSGMLPLALFSARLMLLVFEINFLCKSSILTPIKRTDYRFWSNPGPPTPLFQTPLNSRYHVNLPSCYPQNHIPNHFNGKMHVSFLPRILIFFRRPYPAEGGRGKVHATHSIFFVDDSLHNSSLCRMLGSYPSVYPSAPWS